MEEVNSGDNGEIGVLLPKSHLADELLAAWPEKALYKLWPKYKLTGQLRPRIWFVFAFQIMIRNLKNFKFIV